MRNAIVATAALAAIALVGGVAYWAGGRNAPPPPAPAAAKAGPAPQGVIVEASRVSLVKLPQALGAVGSLRSDETVILRPEVAGRRRAHRLPRGQRRAKSPLAGEVGDPRRQTPPRRPRAEHVPPQNQTQQRDGPPA